MPVLDYQSGSIVENYSINGINTHQTRHLGVDRVVLPDHAIFLIQGNIVSCETWAGQRMPERFWQAGSVAFLPARSEISVRTSMEHETAIIRLNDRLFASAARDHIDHSKIDFRYLDVSDPTVTRMADAMNNIAKSGSFHDWPLLVDSLAVALTVATIRKLSPKSTMLLESVSCGLTSARKRRVADFVETNIHRQISLSEMADVAALSPFHFSRSFKRSTGVSPGRYVAWRRVEAAKNLLRRTVVPIAMVAFSTGFVSQSHFTTAFRTVVGSTPAQYQSDMADMGSRRRASGPKLRDSPHPTDA